MQLTVTWALRKPLMAESWR